MTHTVLIVDDVADNREWMAMLLHHEGYRVTTAADGQAGLAEARRHRPCMILLDLMMPIMDGEHFRAAQMQDASLCDIPVIVVSASDDAVATAAHMHAAGCLQKPVDFDMLTRSLNDHWVAGCH